MCIRDSFTSIPSPAITAVCTLWLMAASQNRFKASALSDFAFSAAALHSEMCIRDRTYWDRQHGAKLGIYQNKVADNMAQYLVPQECGAKTAVRWAKVVDRKGRGLLFTADAAKPMFFSALPYTPHEMESAKHPYELPPVHYTVVRAMGEQMGVGGDDSWGANVHPEYIPDVTKPVEFTFTFRGI